MPALHRRSRQGRRVDGSEYRRMYFDARAAKLLKPGEHLTVDGCPGLRLVATATRRSWIYRYKDAHGRMKQVALGGQWPAMPPHEAAARWQAQRTLRDTGQDPVTQRKAARQEAKAVAVAPRDYLVRQLVADFIAGPLQERQAAGATAAQRALDRVLEEDPDFAAMPAREVKRSHCFAILDERKVPTRKLPQLASSWPMSRIILETSAEAFPIADAALATGHEVRVVPSTLATKREYRRRLRCVATSWSSTASWPSAASSTPAARTAPCQPGPSPGGGAGRCC